jgi:uncharacterized membrane protein
MNDDTPSRLLTLVLLSGTGVALTALALPLIRRRIRPNALYGLRVPATLADESIWYDANERSGRVLFVIGIVLILLGLGSTLVSPQALERYLAVSVVVMVLAVTLAAIDGWRYANRLLRERGPQGDGTRNGG